MSAEPPPWSALIADPDATAAVGLHGLLRRAGADEVRICHSLERALEHLLTFRPSIIFAVAERHGMDGVRLARVCSEQRNPPPVVLLGSLVRHRSSTAPGVSYVLPTPVGEHGLGAALRACLKHPS